MGKRLSREEMTAYQRTRRARIRDSLDVKPSCKAPVKPDVKPDAPAVPCANCADLTAEVSRLRDSIETLEDQLAKGSRATPTAEDAEALRQRVIAGKINSYGKNPVIGRARI